MVICGDVCSDVCFPGVDLASSPIESDQSGLQSTPPTSCGLDSMFLDSYNHQQGVGRGVLHPGMAGALDEWLPVLPG